MQPKIDVSGSQHRIIHLKYHKNPGLVVHAFNSSTWEEESSGSLWVLGQPRIHKKPKQNKNLELFADSNIVTISESWIVIERLVRQTKKCEVVLFPIAHPTHLDCTRSYFSGKRTGDLQIWPWGWLPISCRSVLSLVCCGTLSASILCLTQRGSRFLSQRCMSVLNYCCWCEACRPQRHREKAVNWVGHLDGCPRKCFGG